jgi:hypothetical protein
MTAIQTVPVLRFYGFVAFVLLTAAPARVTSPDSGNNNSNPPVMMETFKVREKHLVNFGIGITFWENKATQRVLEMSVNAVRPDSGADFEGLTPGTRIWTINGVPVDNFEASLETGTELNKIFINRKRGDQVTLEVAQPGHRGTRFVTLTEDSGPKIILLPPGGSNRNDVPERVGPFQLNRKRQLAFGLGLNFWTKGTTKQVAAIYVCEVLWPQSSAASEGLQEGTKSTA